MKQISIENNDLKEILNRYITALLAVDRSSFPYKNSRSDITAEYATGREYLNHMQGKKVDGFPEKTLGIDLMQWTSPHQSLNNAIKQLDSDFIKWSGSRNNAVKMLYPQGGYMGWHHNANAAGYNILMSWSKEGKGYFRYQDPITKELVTMNDSPGWTCKIGYYGPWHEPDRIYWHCASAEHEERMTLGYIIPHQGMWESMEEDIQTA